MSVEKNSVLEFLERLAANWPEERDGGQASRWKQHFCEALGATIGARFTCIWTSARDPGDGDYSCDASDKDLSATPVGMRTITCENSRNEPRTMARSIEEHTRTICECLALHSEVVRCRAVEEAGAENEAATVVAWIAVSDPGLQSEIDVDQVLSAAGLMLARSIERDRAAGSLEQEFRVSMAAYRHAIVDLNAAALNAIIYLKHQLSYSRRTEESWLKLREDETLADAVSRCAFLTGQARDLLETAKYWYISPKFEDLRFDNYSIEQMLRKLLEQFEHPLRVKRMRARLQILGKKPEVMRGDRSLLSLAIANLINNAIKYGNSNTELSITVTFDAQAYTLDIANHGAPIANAEALFANVMPRSEDGRLNGRTGGTGLGLPICVEALRAHWPAAELHYRSVRVDERDSITTFSFELPYRLGANIGDEDRR